MHWHIRWLVKTKSVHHNINSLTSLTVNASYALNRLTAEFPGAHKQCYKILLLIYDIICSLDTINEKIPYALRNPTVSLDFLYC